MEENMINHGIEEEKLDNVAGGANRSRWINYTVMRGDTLSGISNRFGVSVSNLAEWNVICDPDHITPGNKLRIYTSK